jgi:hypothetical protein
MPPGPGSTLPWGSWPTGRQPDVLCLSIAAEPAAAIAVLGADFLRRA